MAGKVGMKGGGGARKGAGRKQKVVLDRSRALQTDDPIAFLTALMRSPSIDMRLRLAGAVALLPYVHRKVGTAGKKELANERARTVAEGTDLDELLGSGRFKPGEPPKLALVKPSGGDKPAA